MSDKTDPTLPMRDMASTFDQVDQGTACTQSSFKTHGKSFFFVGEQGGRFKAMFKLKASREQAERLAAQEPDNYQIGSNIWMTARFSLDEPMPEDVWKAWLRESYELSLPAKKT